MKVVRVQLQLWTGQNSNSRKNQQCLCLWWGLPEGAVEFQNQGVEYFVEKSGGYKRFADNELIYILHPNGETERYSKKRNLFASQPQELNMYPGSVIFVPRKLITLQLEELQLKPMFQY